MPTRRSAVDPAGTPPTTTKQKTAKRRKVDWDAVERDYRTGKFSDIELAAKYEIARESIVRRRKSAQKDDPSAWAQNLAPQVRAATNALLMQETVAQKITEGHTQVTGVILAAAELNKQIISGHRRDMSATRNVAHGLLNELAAAALLAEEQELLAQILAGEGAEPADEARARAVVSKALSINSRITSVKALAETFSKIQDAEYKSYRLEEDEVGDAQKPKRVLLDFVDVEDKSQ